MTEMAGGCKEEELRRLLLMSDHEGHAALTPAQKVYSSLDVKQSYWPGRGLKLRFFLVLQQLSPHPDAVLQETWQVQDRTPGPNAKAGLPSTSD